MNISKLTITSRNKNIKPIRLMSPSDEVLHQALDRVSANKQSLPLKLVKKIAKERGIPDYINRTCYTGSDNAVEDARVLGGNYFNFLF